MTGLVVLIISFIYSYSVTVPESDLQHMTIVYGYNRIVFYEVKIIIY